MSKQILIIEDNDDDVLMIKRGFMKGKIGNELHISENGQIGYDYLLEGNEDKVQLILLDLNMEVMNGFEFLEKRSNTPSIKKIPVVVLTSSARHEDIERAYSLGANAYVEKPIEPKRFLEVMMGIQNFWIVISLTP